MEDSDEFSRIEIDSHSKRGNFKACKPSASVKKAQGQGKKITRQCRCGQKFEARLADIKRGWGVSCSKRCAAVRKTYG